MAGLLADARSLAEVAREEASNFRSNYGHDIPLKVNLTGSCSCFFPPTISDSDQPVLFLSSLYNGSREDEMISIFLPTLFLALLTSVHLTISAMLHSSSTVLPYLGQCDWAEKLQIFSNQCCTPLCEMLCHALIIVCCSEGASNMETHVGCVSIACIMSLVHFPSSLYFMKAQVLPHIGF